MLGIDVRCSDDAESSSVSSVDSLDAGACTGEAVDGTAISVRDLDSFCVGVLTCCSAFGSDGWQPKGTKISIPNKKLGIERKNRSREERLSRCRGVTGLFF